MRLCFYCGEEADTDDHIILSSEGGADNQLNYVDCCDYCNNDRGSTPIAEYMASIHLDGPVPIGITREDYFMNHVLIDREEDFLNGDFTLYFHRCLFCKDEFISPQPDTKYCSKRHKKRANFIRRRTRARAERSNR